MNGRGVRCLLLTFFLSALPAAVSASPVAINVQAVAAQKAGNYYQAIELYRSALDVNPHYSDALLGLAESFFILGEYADGLIYVERALSLEHSNAYLRSLKGRILIGLTRFDDAEHEFRIVLANKPYHPDARFGLAELDVARGRIHNAIERFEEALERLPDNRRALLSLVLLYDQLEQQDVSEEYIKLALRYHPSNSSVRYVAGQHYLNRGDYARAEYHVRLALNLQEHDRKALDLLSRIFLKQGKYDIAIELLEANARTQRNNPDLWYTLGVSYGSNGLIDQAMIAFSRVFRLQSDHEMARLAMEDFLLRNTSMEDERRHSAAMFHFTRAEQLMDRFLLDQALFEYRRGLLLHPYSRQGRLGYARIHQTRGNTARYLRELEILESEGAIDRDLQDELEIQRSIQAGDMAGNWGIDQFLLDRQQTRVMFFYNPAISETVHFQAQEFITRFLIQSVEAVPGVEIARNALLSADFSTAFQKARESGSDYFVLLSINEAERSVHFLGDIYLSRTGRLLESFSVYRTGNDRIASAASRLERYFAELFPVKGTLLARRFSTGLADIGRNTGAQEDMEYLIIRQNSVKPDLERVGLVWEDQDVVGSFRVTRTAELISEGVVQRRGFFDKINPGDLLLDPEAGKVINLNETAPTDSLYRAILSVP